MKFGFSNGSSSLSIGQVSNLQIKGKFSPSELAVDLLQKADGMPASTWESQLRDTRSTHFQAKGNHLGKEKDILLPSPASCALSTQVARSVPLLQLNFYSF